MLHDKQEKMERDIDNFALFTELISMGAMVGLDLFCKIKIYPDANQKFPGVDVDDTHRYSHHVSGGTAMARP